MAGTPLQFAFCAFTLTLTTSPQNLLKLAQGLGGKYINMNSSGYSYQIQFDPNNGANILIGDENVAVSPQQCAIVGVPGAGDSQGTRVPYIAPFGCLWGVAAGAGAALINVAVFQ
jgi:hypothetical protein